MSMDPDIKALFSSETSSKGLIDGKDIDGALAALCLKRVRYGGYILVMRSECDIIISGEPHIALFMWLNLETGRFIARIWSQTITTGHAKTLAEFMEACRVHFMSGKPCLGLPAVDDVHLNEKFVISNSPIPRRISRNCHKTLGQNTSIEAQSCSECLKLEECPKWDNSKTEFEKDIIPSTENLLDNSGKGRVPKGSEMEYMDVDYKLHINDKDPLWEEVNNSVGEDIIKNEFTYARTNDAVVNASYQNATPKRDTSIENSKTRRQDLKCPPLKESNQSSKSQSQDKGNEENLEDQKFYM